MERDIAYQYNYCHGRDTASMRVIEIVNKRLPPELEGEFGKVADELLKDSARIDIMERANGPAYSAGYSDALREIRMWLSRRDLAR